MKEPERAVLAKINDEGHCLWLIDNHSSPRFPIYKGTYKLVYGVPRKVWPMGQGKAMQLYEYYEYELKEQGKESIIDRFKQENLQPLEAYEIEGYFDSDSCCWKEGAKMKLKDLRTGKIMTVALSNWTFSLYDGDELYTPDGKLVLSIKM